MWEKKLWTINSLKSQLENPCVSTTMKLVTGSIFDELKVIYLLATIVVIRKQFTKKKNYSRNLIKIGNVGRTQIMGSVAKKH